MAAALFLALHLVSVQEKELIASRRSLWFALISGLLGLVLAWIPFPFSQQVGVIALALAVASPVVLIWPVRPTKLSSPIEPRQRIDERQIMFSRAELEMGSPRYEEYYGDHPQHKPGDDHFRNLPGLMNPASGKFEALSFAAAAASFTTVKALSPLVAVNPDRPTANHDPAQLTAFIKGWARKLGARDVGIARMRDYHWYTHKGRGESYGQPIDPDHKFGIAFTVEMDHRQLGSAPEGGTLMESAQQYLNAGAIAVQLADFLGQLGHQAEAHIDGNYKVVCPLVGKDAGLGEIGRMGLLMTEGLGPRVRLAVVTTNVPLIANEPTSSPAILDFCSLCRKCADNCPVDAIPAGEPEEVDGVLRWQINSEACFTYWCAVGTDCGQCMKVCPYSHPDNFLHNMVRRGLDKSPRFRKFALWMDDAIYGRSPEALPRPDWVPERKT